LKVKYLVTGAGGFIGSGLVKRLLDSGAHKVYALDNFSYSDGARLRAISDRRLVIIEEDLKSPAKLPAVLKDTDLVFHLAANPDVRSSSVETEVHFSDNLFATYRLLEEMRKTGSSDIVFTSSSTVYGERKGSAKEDDPCFPISVYGGMKLASENLIATYVGSGFLGSGAVLRLANIVGGSSTHGVVYDFVQKLRRNPCELEILGDGKQTKSYLHINDTLDALELVGARISQRSGVYDVYNVGSEDTITVDEIARTVAGMMGLNPKVKYLNTFAGRGWIGDVTYFHLDTQKLKSLGWSPKHNSRSSVEFTVSELLARN